MSFIVHATTKIVSCKKKLTLFFEFVILAIQACNLIGQKPITKVGHTPECHSCRNSYKRKWSCA